MKILLLAYHVSPYRGSECSVAWNHITNIAQVHDVTVIYGSSGDHMGDDDDLIKFNEKDRIENVDWRRVKPSYVANLLNTLNRKGIFTYSFYFAYERWHKEVLDYCKRELDLEFFDVIHYLNPIGYREPGYLWQLGRPYVWGPIGGASSIDPRLLSVLPTSGKFKLLFRKYVNWFQLRYSLRLRKALKKTNYLLTATSENKDVFEDIHNASSRYLPENGTKGIFKGKVKLIKSDDVLNLIWIGRLEAGKALKLLFDSFKHVHVPKKFALHIIGKGPLDESLKLYARELGLDSIITWHGHISREEVFQLFESADLHLITSVSEGNPTTIWEAMQYGVPTISLDHCGMHDTLTGDSGIKVEIDSYPIVVKNYGRALNDIAENPELLKDLQRGVKTKFYDHHWDKRVDIFNEVYRKAILDWINKENC